jgi:hypothetical protein
MRNNWKLAVSLAVLVAVLMVSVSAFAHHGAAAYETSKQTTLTGTVTAFQFVNPHVLISVDVKDAATGKIEKWQGELTSPNRLSRAGWTKSSLKPGDQITIIGGTSKTGLPTMWINKVIKDGQEISQGAGGN